MTHLFRKPWVARLHGFWRLAFLLGVATLSAAVAAVAAVLLFFIAVAALRPAPGTWATTLHAGPLTLKAEMASLIWLGTTPWIAQQLDGRTLPSPAGPVRASWDAGSQTLSLHCGPCKLRNASWGGAALDIASADLTVRRKWMQLHGTLSSGALAANWTGQMARTGLLLELELPSTPVRDGYALFSGAIPELATAQIDGSFALHASLSLPSGELHLAPQLVGMAVQGLGTDQWGGLRSVCAKDLPAAAQNVNLSASSLLARAVIAAEDQRFFEHAGFDVLEITDALRSNQRAESALRGASTLSQQVAKLLVTGGERSPVRKLRELLYAVEMEQTLGKARILRLYLEHAPWGANLCGAQAAAHVYFAKRADQLTLQEAAWLAAMLHNPVFEAQRWAATGRINEARMQWVARNVRTSAGLRRLRNRRHN